jgi:predicted aminopeptidase
MADGINSIDELRKAQAAAQAQGTSITNYEEWAQILEDFDIAGIQSTGTYASDVRLHEQVIKQIQDMVEQVQEEQHQDQVKAQNNEATKTEYKSDKEQTLKANVANATSSVIMADYMKYYHLLQ